MNVLIIGSGAREHAIAAALARSKKNPRLFCCGTTLNPGIFYYTQDYWIGNITDLTNIIKCAQAWQIELAIIGPEAPLEKGLADALQQAHIPTIGPKQNLARIETSKGYARELMQKYRISGLPKFKMFADMSGIEDFLLTLGEGNHVVKANGLMSGKGVKVAGEHLHTIKEALQFCQEIFAAKQSLVIEEKLIGQEFSLMCFCDGNTVVPMPVVQDHKRAYVDDLGPNTGGMGSYSDANHSLPFLKESDVKEALQINTTVMQALQADCQEKYHGILYGSFIATRDGVFVIEFNARFGDPEALNVLAILESDFLSICQAMVTNTLASTEIKFLSRATVCKYAVPNGYPDNPIKNSFINIEKVQDKSCLYLAAVRLFEDKLLATGSRAAAVVGVADSIYQAEKIAQTEMDCITGDVFHRPDIGSEMLIQKRIDDMRKLRSL